MKRFAAVRDGDARPAFMRLRDAGLLDARIEAAERALADCRLCPHECGVNRHAGETGECGVGAEAHVAAEMVHLGEVPELAPAWTVFLSGCTMRCCYCRKWELIEHPDLGRVLEPEWFSTAAERAVREGARTMKLLGGTPEPHVAALLRALRETQAPLPVMWEATMFISDQCLRLMEGTVDLIIANLRYGNDTCALELSGVSDYIAPALAALRDGLQWTDVAVRHLVLPGHLECCTRPLAELLEQVAPEVELTLLMQYVPFWRAAEHPPLERRLTDEERDAAVRAVGSAKARWSVADLT